MASAHVVLENTCDCCGNEPAVGVASSGVMPMSIAWGLECLKRRAEPWSAIEFLLEQAEGHADAFAEWFLDGTTYRDGKYLSIREALADWKPGASTQDVSG